MKEFKYPNLRAEMARNRETQQDLAELLGVSIPTVWRKLSGIFDWTISEIEIICEHYNKDYNELFK